VAKTLSSDPIGHREPGGLVGGAIAIRDLKPEDVGQVLEITELAWEPVYAARRAELGDRLFALVHPDWRAEKRAAVRQQCEGASGAYVCVAESGSRVVGFAAYYARPTRRAGVISNNAVHPDFQSRGIATLLYTAVLNRLRALGMRYVTVETGADAAHAPARRAYRKAGFDAVVPTVRFYMQV
jgi:ribosomal protein S18 acetylase RimI-like enzyme